MCLGLPRNSDEQMHGDPPGPFKMILFGLAFVVVMGFVALADRFRRGDDAAKERPDRVTDKRLLR